MGRHISIRFARDIAGWSVAVRGGDHPTCARRARRRADGNCNPRSVPAIAGSCQDPRQRFGKSLTRRDAPALHRPSSVVHLHGYARNSGSNANCPLFSSGVTGIQEDQANLVLHKLKWRICPRRQRVASAGTACGQPVEGRGDDAEEHVTHQTHPLHIAHLEHHLAHA